MPIVWESTCGNLWEEGCSPEASGFGRLRHAVTHVLEE